MSFFLIKNYADATEDEPIGAYYTTPGRMVVAWGELSIFASDLATRSPTLWQVVPVPS